MAITRLRWLICIGSAAFVVSVLAIGLTPSPELTPAAKLVLLSLLVVLFGVSTAAAEIMSAYADEPFAALSNLPAAGYMAFNGLVSFASFVVLHRYGDQILPAVKDDLVLLTLAAGFGGMTIARSKLLTFKTEGDTYPFGPAIVLEAFLKALDRKIDRIRSWKRQEMVFKRIDELGVDEKTFEYAASYLEVCLLSFQNLTSSQKTAIAKAIADYRAALRWPSFIRMMAIGFAMLTILGEENFDQVMGQLKRALQASRPADPPSASP